MSKKADAQKPFSAELHISDLLLEVAVEVAGAERKYSPFNSAHEGYAVILEEVHELWDEVKKGGSSPRDPAAMRKEAIQIAAMALRFVRDVSDDRRKLTSAELGG